MPNRALYAILLTIFIATALGAQTGGSEPAAAFEREGFRVIRSRNQGGMPVWDLSTETGNRFSVSMIGSINDERMAAINSLTDIIYEIDGLTVERMRIVFDDDRASAIIVPEEFEINGKTYQQYMPSGMQFVYDQAPAFDFRMLVENLAVRIDGAFLTEEQFLVRIERAVANPTAYIQSSDPQFLAQHITELQRLVDALEVETRELRVADSSLESQMRSELEQLRLESRRNLRALRAQSERELKTLQAQGERELRTLRAQGERELRTLRAQGETVTEGVREEVARVQEEREQALNAFREETTTALENIVAESLTLADQFTKLRDGSVVMASRNLFGSLKGIPAETIATVVELRDSNPKLTADEARTQVNERLSEDQPQLHGKHVQAIYALFFNDYE